MTFAVFLLVKAINTVRTKMEKAEAKEAAAVPPPKRCVLIAAQKFLWMQFVARIVPAN